MKKRNYTPYICLLIFIVMLAAYAVFLPFLAQKEAVGTIILLYFWLFMLYAISIYYVPNFCSHKKTYVFIIVSALVFRLLALLHEPFLSNDIYRYIWDGKLAVNNINPYLYPPNSPLLETVRDAAYFKMSHHSVFTSYPPLAQFFFALAYRIHPTVISFKLLFTLFDIATMFSLLYLLKRYKRPLAHIIIYAWHPLVIIEVAGQGHYDSIPLFFVVLTIASLHTHKFTHASVCSLAAAITKPFALPLVLVTLSKISLKKGLLLCCLGVSIYLPFFSAHSSWFTGMITYLNHWEFNGSVFPVLLHITRSYTATKTVLFLLITSVILYTIKKKSDPTESLFYIIGALILFSPTVYPWYVMWIIPFMTMRPHIAWLTLTGSVFLSYSVLIGYLTNGTWQELTSIRFIEYTPFFLLLIAARSTCGYRRAGRTSSTRHT